MRNQTPDQSSSMPFFRGIDTCWALICLMLLCQEAIAQTAQQAQPPKSCANIVVKGVGVQEAVKRVGARAVTLCGDNGAGGQIAQGSQIVQRQLDQCVDSADPEYNTSLRGAFDVNQGQRAKDVCKGLKSDLQAVETFCQEQGKRRSTGQAVIDHSGEALAWGGPKALGQFQALDSVASSYRFVFNEAEAFKKLTAALRQRLEANRRQSQQNSENIAHSIDDLMRKQETFFLEAPKRRAALFDQRAAAARDPKDQQRLRAAASACRAAAVPNSGVVKFRQAMENYLLPNQENLYKMARALDEQAAADVQKAKTELAAAEANRDKLKPQVEAERPKPDPARPTAAQLATLRQQEEERQRALARASAPALSTQDADALARARADQRLVDDGVVTPSAASMRRQLTPGVPLTDDYAREVVAQQLKGKVDWPNYPGRGLELTPQIASDGGVRKECYYVQYYATVGGTRRLTGNRQLICP